MENEMVTRKKLVFCFLLAGLILLAGLALAQKPDKPSQGKGWGKGGSKKIRIIAPDPLPMGIVGEEYQVNITVEGGTPPYTWKVTGELPPGLSFTPGEGDTLVLSGPDRETVIAALRGIVKE